MLMHHIYSTAFHGLGLRVMFFSTGLGIRVVLYASIRLGGSRKQDAKEI